MIIFSLLVLQYEKVNRHSSLRQILKGKCVCDAGGVNGVVTLSRVMILIVIL